VSIYDISIAGGVARITLSTRRVAEQDLLHAFLNGGSGPLSPVEVEYLDGHGNGNGGYDVGDLRAYLKRW
jgi:hypothetical protein